MCMIPAVSHLSSELAVTPQRPERHVQLHILVVAKLDLSTEVALVSQCVL